MIIFHTGAPSVINANRALDLNSFFHIEGSCNCSFPIHLRSIILGSLLWVFFTLISGGTVDLSHNDDNEINDELPCSCFLRHYSSMKGCFGSELMISPG